MPLYDFRCRACDHVQEEFLSRSSGSPEDPCEECGAEAAKRERMIGTPTPVGPIFSNVVDVAPGWSGQVHKKR